MPIAKQVKAAARRQEAMPTAEHTWFASAAWKVTREDAERIAAGEQVEALCVGRDTEVRLLQCVRCQRSWEHQEAECQPRGSRHLMARNSACICGSGRKFKACCGKGVR